METLIAANAKFVRGEWTEAAQIYQTLAWQGDLDAMFNLGYVYQFGLGVPLDCGKAADCYSVALYLPGGDAAYNLAVLQMNGQGVPRDIAKGIKTMQQSAEAGCPEAQLYLATAYSVGYAGNPVYSNICRIPFHKPESRYDFAALDGTAEDPAMRDRIEEERCRAVLENAAEALRYLTFAATCDDEDDVYGATITNAKCLLGMFHMEGIGCPIDRKFGTKLLLEAAHAGSEEARQYLLDAAQAPNASPS